MRPLARPRAVCITLPTAEQPDLVLACGRCEATVTVTLAADQVEQAQAFLSSHAHCLATPGA